MPPKKGGRGRGRGRAKKKVEEEVVEEVEQTDESSQDESTNADTSLVSDNDASMDATEQPASESEEPETVAEEQKEEEKQENGTQEQSKDGEESQDAPSVDEDTPSMDEETDASVSSTGKRKAEEDSTEEGSTNKKAKTEEEEDDPDRPITLFCGNLDPDLSGDTLKEFFEANDVEVHNPRKIGFKRFGYVDVLPKDLEKALEVNGKELNGEPIRIDRSKPKGGTETANDGRMQGGDSKTLFVKNLKETVTEDQLREFFTGETITEIRLPKKRDGLCKGFGYVVFDTEETLERMMKEKQNQELDGETVFLDYTDQKSQHAGGGGKSKEFGPSKVLFVRNLAFQVTEDELKEIFDGCKACRIPPNEYGQSKGFGFVEFETQETAEKAKADKDGLEIHGREVQLAFANDKPGGMSGATARGGGYGGGGQRGGRGGGWEAAGVEEEEVVTGEEVVVEAGGEEEAADLEVVVVAVVAIGDSVVVEEGAGAVGSEEGEDDGKPLQWGSPLCSYMLCLHSVICCSLYQDTENVCSY
ncbi:nucleolin-like [Mya arenaria]|uniref:nucleolin-like n=1 Tax=Mya arenaria TaxID=6604 RepID=UPI0022E352B6|nr:nucleolin-like [Mya arenaria]